MLPWRSNEQILRSHVVHSLPGRLRLGVKGLSYLSEDLPAIASEMKETPSLRRIRLSALTESVLLEYDVQSTDVDELCKRIDFVLARYMKKVIARRVEGMTLEHGDKLTTGRLLRRLGVNALAFAANRLIFGPTHGQSTLLRRFTSPAALTSLALSVPMARSAWEGLRVSHRPNADFLTCTSIVASLLLNNASSALMILALSDLAELMTTYTVERTRASIKKMLSVGDDDVWKAGEDGTLSRCPVTKIKAGDRIIVHTGEKISVDGQVLSGRATIDQSAITGEFVPVEKRWGDEVFAGTLVTNGTLTVRASKVGDQTIVSRIVKMVEESECKKAPIQRYADRFSNFLVPLNYALCLMVWLLTKDVTKALNMLVIDYSCGIKLSTATAFSAAINAGLRRGVLIKGGAFLEQMNEANSLLFDKTGTVTEGKPRIVSMKMLVSDMDERDVLAYAMAAEETSTHPLAGAILNFGRGFGVSIPLHGDIETEVSRGSKTDVGGNIIRVGSLRYMAENDMEGVKDVPYEHVGIATYVAVDRRIVAVLHAMDRPRDNVRRAINSLRMDGIGDISLLTGDMEAEARTVAMEIGADAYKAQLLPEQKVEEVLKLQAGGNTVMMVGDGINDAPALAYADVGISLGSKSTDIAIETSDVVISKDELMAIPEIRSLAKQTMRTVSQNFALAIGINTAGLILGAASSISVWKSALLHNASTILVVANSCRLLFFKK